MNPAILSWSRRVAAWQCLLSLLLGGLCLLVLHDMDWPGAAPPAAIRIPDPAPDPTPEILFDETLQHSPRSGVIDRATGGWATIMVLMGGVFFFFAIAAARLVRIFRPVAILQLRAGRLERSGSVFVPGENIALGQVRSIVYDRVDRFPTDIWQEATKALSLGAHIGLKLGQRRRYQLQITWQAREGATGIFNITDMNVEGGAEQLERFTAYLRAMIPRHSRVQH